MDGVLRRQHQRRSYYVDSKHVSHGFLMIPGR